MKKCELCNSTARVLCESDGAALCWDCDSNIHSSNFLFANHLRSLLCNTCHSPTPWTGSGSTLARTFSLCDSCILTDTVTHHRTRTAGSPPPPPDHHNHRQDPQNTEQDEDDTAAAAGDSDSDSDDDDGDNQVVPISSYSAPIPPPPSLSSNIEDPRRKFRFR